MSIIKHVPLQKIVAHDFRYDPRIYLYAKRVNFVLVADTTGTDFNPYVYLHISPLRSLKDVLPLCPDQHPLFPYRTNQRTHQQRQYNTTGRFARAAHFNRRWFVTFESHIGD